MLPPTSPEAPTNSNTKHSRYYAQYVPHLDKTCPKEFPMSSDWGNDDDEDEDDQSLKWEDQEQR